MDLLEKLSIRYVIFSYECQLDGNPHEKQRQENKPMDEFDPDRPDADAVYAVI